MRGKKRLENLLDEELYKKCRQVMELETFNDDYDILLFVQFYQLMVWGSKQCYDNEMRRKFIESKV